MSEDDDSDVFRAAMADVTPKKAAAERDRSRPKPAPDPVHSRQFSENLGDELFADEPWSLESGDELRFIRDGFPPRLLKRLRRGYYSVEAEVDLHDMTVSQARPVLDEFMADISRHRIGCCRIIHGHGQRRGVRRPALKNLVATYLRRKKNVVAFTSSVQRDGGSGATLVLLKP